MKFIRKSKLFLRYFKNFIFLNKKIKKSKRKKTLIYYSGSDVYCGGVADRIRGVLSLYKVSIILGCEFKIVSKDGLDFSEYFDLAKNDWNNPVDYSLSSVWDSYYSGSTSASNQFNDIIFFIKKHFVFFDNIFYTTNANICEGEEYGRYFNSLFSFKKDIENEAISYQKKLGNKYSAIVLRFQNLLADFDEPGYYPLEENEANILKAKSSQMVNKIINNTPDINFYVASDSIKFLRSIKIMEKIIVVDQEMHHPESVQADSSHIYRKSFIDLYLLMGAKNITNLVGPKMYESGFPKISALIAGCKIDVIYFD